MILAWIYKKQLQNPVRKKTLKRGQIEAFQNEIQIQRCLILKRHSKTFPVLKCLFLRSLYLLLIVPVYSSSNKYAFNTSNSMRRRTDRKRSPSAERRNGSTVLRMRCITLRTTVLLQNGNIRGFHTRLIRSNHRINEKFRFVKRI